jgi:hypothetical protein
MIVACPNSESGNTSQTAVPATGWQEIRRGRKLLFEYHEACRLIRIVRNRRTYIIDLREPHFPLMLE